MSTTVKRVCTAEEAEVGAFAAISGDKNKIHVDSEYAEDTLFGEPVVHGVHGLSWVSACIADLPEEGDAILTHFGSIEFANPIYHGEPVEVEARLHTDEERENFNDIRDGEYAVTFNVGTDEELKLSGTAYIIITDDEE